MKNILNLPQSKEAKEKRVNRLYKPALLGALVLSLATMHSCAAETTPDTEKWADKLVATDARVSICDHAKFRNAPTVNNRPDINNGYGAVVMQLDFGNMAKDTCADIKVEKLYQDYNGDKDGDGVWYGFTESSIAQNFSDTGLDPENKETIIWANHQTVTPIYDQDDN